MNKEEKQGLLEKFKAHDLWFDISRYIDATVSAAVAKYETNLLVKPRKKLDRLKKELLLLLDKYLE